MYNKYIKYKQKYLKLKNELNIQHGGEITNSAVLLILFHGKPSKPKVLLLKNSYGDEGWSTPGGHINNGENSLEAAKRELEEETGINDNKLWEHIKLRQFENKYKTEYFIVHTCKKPKIKISQEHTDYNWFNLDDLIDLIRRNRDEIESSKLKKGKKISIGINDLIHYKSTNILITFNKFRHYMNSMGNLFILLSHLINF